MNSNIDIILDKLLVEMHRGKSVDDCLKEYPDLAAELRPLLQLASEIEGLPKPEPEAQAVESVLAKVRDLTITVIGKKRHSIWSIFSLRPALVRVCAVVLLIALAGWTSVSLSAKSLPGDFLYPMKLFTEKVQYVLTVSPEGKAELHLVYADRRTDEFVLTFKEGEKINRALLDAMLSEISLAMECTQSLPEENSGTMMERVKACNHHQMKVLEKTKTLVCDYDRDVIDEAIKTCRERHHCFGCDLNIDSTDSCPCQGNI
jgi:hypothetical protein